MHLPVRLRVPLVGLALCSTALLISACGGSSASDTIPTARRSRPTAVAVVGAETVPRRSSTALMTQVCVQYKAAKKACPKPGSAERKQLQQSFVAQLVTQAEFDEAGKQLKVTVKQADDRHEPQEARAAVRQGHQRQGRRRQVEEGPGGQSHDAGRGRREPPRRAAAPGHLRQADEGRDRRRRGREGVLHEEQEDATRRPRAARSATSWSRTRPLPTRSTRSSPRATRSSRRWPRSTRSIPARRKTGGKLGSIQKGQTVPAFDKVAFSRRDRQGRAAGQELLRLARDRGHGRLPSRHRRSRSTRRSRRRFAPRS